MPARPRPAVPVVPVSSSNNTVPEIVIASEAVVVSPPQPQPQPKVKPPKPPKPAFIPAPGNKSSHTSPPAQRSPRPNAVVSVDLATEQQAKPVVAEQQDEPVVAEQQAKPVVAEQQDEHVVLVTTSEQHSTDVVEPAKELSTDKEAVVLHEDLILPTAPENPFIDESALHVDPLETLHTDPPATHEPLHEETPKAEGAEENPFLEGPSSLGQEEVTPSNPFLDDVASTPPAANTAPARPPRNAAALADAVTETAVTLPVRPPRVTPSAAAPLPEAPEEEPQLTPTKPRMPPRRSFAPKPAVAQAATVTTADRPTEADNDLLTVQQPIPVLPVRPQSASANTSVRNPKKNFILFYFILFFLISHRPPLQSRRPCRHPCYHSRHRALFLRSSRPSPRRSAAPPSRPLRRTQYHRRPSRQRRIKENTFRDKAVPPTWSTRKLQQSASPLAVSSSFPAISPSAARRRPSQRPKFPSSLLRP